MFSGVRYDYSDFEDVMSLFFTLGLLIPDDWLRAHYVSKSTRLYFEKFLKFQSVIKCDYKGLELKLFSLSEEQHI